MMLNPDFSQFPKLTIGRFVLREINVADASLIHKLRSDEETNALIDRENSKSIEDALLFIDRIKSNVRRNESVYWVICFQNVSDLVGTIGCWNFNLSAETAEIGYELLREFRGQGIMNEVLPGVIRFLFEKMKLKWITALTTEQNIPSVKLLEKFGFQLADSDDDSTEHVPGMLTFILRNLQ
jgi:[ribosomal protein S5]-alanine N-acetyltransferase